MIKLLPLEQNAKLTEITQEIELFGSTCIIKRNCVVDVRASVYEVLNHINAVFPEIDIPFTVIFENTVNYVKQWEAHYKEIAQRALRGRTE